MFITPLLFVSTVIALFIDHFLRIKKYKWLSQFPGPRPNWPLVGNAFLFLGHPSKFDGTFEKKFKKYGLNWKMWLMRKPTLITADPSLLKVLLGTRKHLEKNFMYDYSVRVVFGRQNIVSTHVDAWKSDRRILNRIFNVNLFEESFRRCVDDWSLVQNKISSHGNNPVECLSIFRSFFISTIFKSLATDPGFVTDDILHFIDERLKSSLYDMKQVMMKPLRQNRLFGTSDNYTTPMVHISRILRALTSSSTAEISTSMDAKEGKPNGTKKEDMSDLLPQLKTSGIVNKIFGPENLEKSIKWKYSQLITLLTAGADTSAIALTMTLFFLAVNSDCQKKAQEEVDFLLEGNEDGRFRYQELSKLKYLRMCLKEALRIHPPLPFIGRIASEDIILDDGRIIPQGSSVMLVIPEIHRNPDFFPNPKVFDPERFNDSNISKISSYTHLPFSAGPRNCIGQRYAEVILIATLANVLRRFSVSTDQKAEDIKILYEIAGTPHPEVELHFQQR